MPIDPAYLPTRDEIMAYLRAHYDVNVGKYFIFVHQNGNWFSDACFLGSFARSLDDSEILSYLSGMAGMTMRELCVVILSCPANAPGGREKLREMLAGRGAEVPQIKEALGP